MAREADDRAMVVFDFDATLTYCDSFLPFLRFQAGRLGFWRRIFGLGPDFIAWRRGTLNGQARQAMKAKACKAFLAGMTEADFKQCARQYALKHDRHLLNRLACERLRHHVDAGDEVVIVTASPEEMVRPIVETFDVEVIGTRLASEGGVLTGSLSSPNCRGPEKITRLTERYGPRGKSLKAAYGDSDGDRDILAAAEGPHYRDFRGPLFRLRAVWVLFRLLV